MTSSFRVCLFIGAVAAQTPAILARQSSHQFLAPVKSGEQALVDLHSLPSNHWVDEVSLLLLIMPICAFLFYRRDRKTGDIEGFFAECRTSAETAFLGREGSPERPSWLNNIEVKSVVGRGTFGTVNLAHFHGDPEQAYALKVVKKSTGDQVRWQARAIRAEMEVATTDPHPCIVRFFRAYEDTDAAYFLTEILGGGDLFAAIREIGTLGKQHVQYYAGSIVLALEHLHQRGIMYRDLKPENVLLDTRGRAKLVDFGSCKVARTANTLVGTSEYMAPEVILGTGYTNVVDWWALGIIMHEFLLGPLPFGRDGQDRRDIFAEILNAPLRHLESVEDPLAVSVLRALLQKNPEQRLGIRGAIDIQRDLYFRDLNWEALQRGDQPAPWTPVKL